MATIKPIESQSIHQIQSGQVIVDLCSVVKELVENSLDAGATSIDVRFKNSGIESIEVQDNGRGIAPEDYETIALKHYTSKLSAYSDLSSLTTFGFRGEALSSLCALSNFHIITARDSDGPRGTRLDFETSGKLKGTSTAAAQRGTIVAVETIFKNLPVRKKELEKNIKREWTKVLGVLYAYAAISTGVKFGASNQASKGKKVVIFSTRSNPTTKENIANVFGAKTLLALLPLNLGLSMHPSPLPKQSDRSWSTQEDIGQRDVRITGHISRPVVGEGRQTPDRQMFFVNSRPCELPQVAKAFNEVYKMYNITQSPFIFANLVLDTNSYDVNVSPDKRTILLHDQSALLEELKKNLIELFEAHDQTVPQASMPPPRKLPVFKQLTINKASDDGATGEGDDSEAGYGAEEQEIVDEVRSNVTSSISSSTPSTTSASSAPAQGAPIGLISQFVGRDVDLRKEAPAKAANVHQTSKAKDKPKTTLVPRDEEMVDEEDREPNYNAKQSISPPAEGVSRIVQDFNARMASQEAMRVALDASEPDEDMDEDSVPALSNSSPQQGTPNVIQNAFDRMRPKRTLEDTATVTIGDKTTTLTFGTPPKKRRIHTPKTIPSSTGNLPRPGFTSSLRLFAAPGTAQSVDEDEDGEEEEVGNETDNEDSDTAAEKQRAVAEDGDDEQFSGAEDHDKESRLDRDLSPDDDEVVSSSRASSKPLPGPEEDDSDEEFIDESEKKAREEARVAQLIADAEEAAARPTSNNLSRATSVLSSTRRKDSTLTLMQPLTTSVAGIQRRSGQLMQTIQDHEASCDLQRMSAAADSAGVSEEDRLALTVSKPDFLRMRIIGQFNLGFILAVRPSSAPSPGKINTTARNSFSDEMFIIDQHASDEKYNFERLQDVTVVQNQRLVQPRILELTAIEEEIILSNPDALAKNGFLIETDTSGESPVGKRCKLVSLPMSKEVVFDLQDLDELLVLLSDHSTGDIPRPSKVRKMFAMRACRSSIMVGKTLTKKQMGNVLNHMGELDKPWNCPHGRPTMRHLRTLACVESWKEGDLGEDGEDRVDWSGYARRKREERRAVKV
ncbi:DNA mismatch repair protein MutL [Aulographum hederae CBS 113979]|uniref:DNA mismatch repair protein PMS1 n=1 Tax=Aulographum hederae CBS 113979 TaxID=1176131 RepID=A0A6G1HGS1_9PEZI|nr:DNA mismatch repair protein MutL [Aulographum hederae CBS 113979]